MIRSRLVQEVRYGLIWRLAGGEDPVRTKLECFVRRMEAAVPRGESWLRLENVPGWEPIEEMTLEVGRRVTCVAWAPVAAPLEWRDSIVAGSWDGKVHLWNLCNGAVRVFDIDSIWVTSVFFSPDGNNVVSITDAGHMRLHSIEGKELKGRNFKTHRNEVCTTATHSADGSLLANGYGSTVRLYDLHGDTSVHVLDGHSDLVLSLAFSPNDRYLASGSRDRTVRIWDLERFEVICVYDDEIGKINAVAFSPDGRSLVIGSDDHTVRLWDFGADESNVRVFDGHNDTVSCVAFSPDGRKLASGSQDGTVRLWDLDIQVFPGELFEGHFAPVTSLAFSPDGQRLVSGSTDSILRIWNAKRCVHPGEQFEGHTDRISAAAFNHDCSLIASGSRDNSIRLWKLNNSASYSLVFDGHTESITCLAFSPDLRYFASGSLDQSVCLWDLHSNGSAIAVFKGHTEEITSLAFSPENRVLASASLDGSVRLYKLCDDRQTRVIPNAGDRIHSMAFLPDGSGIVLGCCWELVWVSNINDSNASKRFSFQPHFGVMRSVAISTDGLSVASGSDDRTVRVCDLPSEDSGHFSPRLFGHSRPITSVAFGPNGRYLASGSEDRKLRLWDLDHPRHQALVFDCAGTLFALGTDPKRPDRFLAACAAQSDGIHFPVVYSLRVVTGPIPIEPSQPLIPGFPT